MFFFSPSPFHFLAFSSRGPFFISALLCQFTNHLLSFPSFFDLVYLVSYFSLAPCTRLNWQFSVSFQVHVKSSSSCRIVIMKSAFCFNVDCCRLAGFITSVIIIIIMIHICVTTTVTCQCRACKP